MRNGDDDAVHARAAPGVRRGPSLHLLHPGQADGDAAVPGQGGEPYVVEL